MDDDRNHLCWSLIGVWGDASCPTLDEVIHCHNCEVYEAAGRSLLERDADDHYRAEWTEVLTLAKDVGERETLSVTVFRLGEEWFALPTEDLKEVTEVHTVRTLPHRSGKILKGLVNIRGELLLCVSLANLLEIAIDADTTEHLSHVVWPRIVVIERDGDRWGFPADEVYGIQRIDPGTLRDVPTTVARDHSSFTRGLFVWEGRNVGLLDAELVFYTLRRRIF